MKFINWIGKALSEKLEPSSRRLMAFVFALTIAYCEVYNTHKEGKFNTTHLGYLLVAIGVLAGVATVSQIVQLLRGGSTPAQPTTEPAAENPAQ